jgi:precorrin-2 dehydrogenase/sirohydrochlorin ferrochelatase
VTYPVTLEGSRFAALVVGGGEVADRKARHLLEGRVRVRVVAPEICRGIEELALDHPGLTLERRAYQASDCDAATIVIAATNDSATNALVARDALARGRLVNVVDDPDAGNFVTPSVHRSGDLMIAVSTGRLPGAAAAIRSELAARFDNRYAVAIKSLRALRDRLLGSGQREEWTRASTEIVGPNFCDDVEAGTIDAKVAAWR